jgi:LPPG:FO 2-phospho-L-lactate transferase
MVEAIGRARNDGTPVVGVSGIVGGRALKGPADRMLASLGHESSALGVARLYAGLATGFVLDPVDAGLVREIQRLGLRTLVTDTLMVDNASRARVGAEVLAFALSLAPVAG